MIRGFVKAFMFLSSYIPLFIVLGILNYTNANLVSVLSLLTIVSIGFLLYVLRVASTMNGEYHNITSIRGGSNRYLEYIIVYIIPFLGFDFLILTNVLALSLLFCVVGALYVSSDSIYMNPMLSFLGYDLYKVTSTSREFMIITKKRLGNPKKLKIYKIAEGVGMVK